MVQLSLLGNSGSSDAYCQIYNLAIARCAVRSLLPLPYKLSFALPNGIRGQKEKKIYMKQHRGNPDVPTYRFIYVNTSLRQPNPQTVRKIKSPLAHQWQHFVRTKRSRLQTFFFSFFFLESGKWPILTFRRSVSARFIASSIARFCGAVRPLKCHRTKTAHRITQ